MTTPPTDDFAMKVWNNANLAWENAPNAADGMMAAGRVISDAFDKVRAEERARIVAWLRDTATPAVYADDFADAIERGAHLKG